VRRFALGVLVCAPALAQPVLTAVHALADHHTSRWTTDRDAVRRIAGVCRIVPSSPVFTLACSGAPPGEPRAGRRYFYTVVLLRDLEENIYLAACAEPVRNTRCDELKAGQTFSAEVEDQTLRIVIEEEQLPMRILESRPKPVSIDSPTRGTPSQTRPSPGTPSNVPWSKVSEARGSPSQVQPSSASVTSGAPSKVSVPDVSVAAAAPTAGRLTLYCAASQARVWVNGRLAGVAPLEIPVVPGRHAIRVQAPGHKEWTRTVIVLPGGAVKVTADLER